MSVDAAARRRELGYASYSLDEEEFVGTVDASIAEVEAMFWELCFERMPLAALKSTPDGRIERGSWAHRDDPLAERQLHVMLFEADDGVDLYAHDEFNAFNPRVALKHYRGVGVDAEAVSQRLQKMVENSSVKLSL